MSGMTRAFPCAAGLSGPVRA